MKIRIKGMKIVGINTIRKAIDKSKLVLLDTTIKGKNKTFTGKRWVNPSSALDLFKKEIGVKGDIKLKFTLKSNKKVSFSEKQIAEVYLKQNQGQSFQTFIKQSFIIGKESKKQVKETSTNKKRKVDENKKKQNKLNKIIDTIKFNTPSKSILSTTENLVKLASMTSTTLGTDIKNVHFTSATETTCRGACRLHYGSMFKGKLDFGELSLQSNDERKVEHRIKTVFHECFHLKANTYSCESIVEDSPEYKKWMEIEETMAECAAQYLYNEYDESEKLSPSYTRYLIKNLPKLKQIDGYKDCKTIYDFGRRALENRVATDKVEWLSLYEKLENISIDEDYYKPYENYVEKNKDKLLDRIIANSPVLEEDREHLSDWFDDYLFFRELGENVGGDYRRNYEGFIVNAMLDIGVL